MATSKHLNVLIILMSRTEYSFLSELLITGIVYHVMSYSHPTQLFLNIALIDVLNILNNCSSLFPFVMSWSVYLLLFLCELCKRRL